MPRKLRALFLVGGLALAATSLAAAPDGAAASSEPTVPRFILLLAVALAGAKLMGSLAASVGQPAVLGELLAGVLLGPSVMGSLIPALAIDPDVTGFHLLAEIGIVLLLFEVGLETDLKELMRSGPSALVVAAIGVVVPFGLGVAVVYGLARSGSLPIAPALVPLLAVFLGATLTATSVGITARVLQDLGRLSSPEARILIGAAVVDDVLGLVILAVVTAIGAAAATGLPLGQAVSPGLVASKLVVAVLFLVLAVLAGRWAAPRVFGLVERLKARNVVVVAAIAFALALAAIAAEAGSALIIGGFAAGLALDGIDQFDEIEHHVKPVVDVFSPVFFVLVGAAVDVRTFDVTVPENRSVLLLAGVLLVAAIAGKLVAGLGVLRKGVSRWIVGVGMIPRGEVGLIFAQAGYLVVIPIDGRPERLLPAPIYSAVTLTVMLTTFVAPPILRRLVARGAPPEETSPP
jgi:Kef-type K+ transport system membrane component KefB